MRTSSLQGSVTGAFSWLRPSFDEAVFGLPLVGSWLGRGWQVCEVGRQEIAASPGERSVATGRPVVARLSEELGIRLNITLPAAARGDLEAAARLSLATRSPIPPQAARVVVDTLDLTESGGMIAVPVILAAQNVVAAAEAYARTQLGRVDAVDVVVPGREREAPTVDLRRGALARRPGFSPWILAVSLSAILLVCGSAGFGLAAWRDTEAAARDASPPARDRTLVGDLTARRRSDVSIIDAVEAASRSLPSSAYLKQLEINGANMRMLGETTDPAIMAPALEADHLMSNVRFAGPLRDSAAGRRTFDLSLDLRRDAGAGGGK